MTEARINARRIAACRALIHDRALIGNVFGFAICPCPNLDILLDLGLAELEQREIYLWSLCVAAHAPFSTAYRKIGDLEFNGLVVRQIDLRDQRRTLLHMTTEGFHKLISLLDQRLVCSSSPSC